MILNEVLYIYIIATCLGLKYKHIVEGYPHLQKIQHLKNEVYVE